jgi:predicted ABC-type ATPase
VDDWNSPIAVIQAANKAKATREYCLNQNISMAFETVFSTQEKLDFLKRAKDAGFFIRFFFVCTNDPSINAQRVAQRVMEGGDDVPIPKIIDRYYRSITNSLQAMTWADRAYFYDNTEINRDPLLLFRVHDRKIERTYAEVPLWAKKIHDSLRNTK